MATATAPHKGELVDEELEREIEQVESVSTLAALNKSEIDTQISTAKAYPRSIKRFLNEARQMVTLTEEIAGECTYLLPRGGKKIMGPSARFAEIVASAWGNCRAGARIVDEQERFVVAQGVFNDVQRNVVITYEVRRRITDKHSARYNDDMIGVTSNAACSIAMRNAVLKGIPKAFWKTLWDEALHTARGDIATLSSRRDAMLKAFADMGAKESEVLSLIGVEGKEDVTLDHLVELRAIYTAVKDGDTTIEQLLERQEPTGRKVGRSAVNDQLADPPKAAQPASGNATAPTPEEMKDGLFNKAPGYE
jgi:hypothetical protein